MPGSRNDRAAALRLAPLLLLLAAAPALAAGPAPLGPPLRLGPPQSFTPPASDATASEKKPIEVGRLSPVDSAWAGPLGPDKGGFPAALWQGTPRSFVVALLPRLPATTSPTLQSLSRRLLLSNADAPAGGQPGDAADLIALRVDRLVAAGEVAAAQSLLADVPNRSTIEELERRSVELAFLSDDPKHACKRVGDDISRFNSLWWSRALIACQALAGDQAKVSLGLDLLHEQKTPKDAAFDALVAAPIEHRVKLERLPDPTPIELALLAARKEPLPADSLATASPAVLRAWASADSAPPAQRLVAGERAAAFGALPIADLRALYEKASFTDAERADPASAAAKMPGARGDALLYAAAQAQSEPAKRAELIRALLETGRKNGGFLLLARVVEPLLLALPPTKDLAPLAGDAVRALLVTGHGAEAVHWLAVADSETAQALYPIARLGITEGGPAADGKQLAASRDLLASEGSDGPRRAALALALLDAFGDPVGPADWAPLAAKLPLASLDLPGAPIWFDLPRAAEGRRLGETVLLALVTAGENGRLATQPARLVPAVAALRAVGLEKDARALAIEGAVTGGL